MISVEFNQVGKMYRLGRVGTGTLSHDLNRWWQTRILHREDPYLKIGEVNDRSVRGSSDYVWALKDISFQVEQGEVVGIIGKNGAGKSTLLKLLSNITSPTTGSIRYQGRVASLLEVGTGFHPEMTGRENIFMNGAILGMTRQEIDSKIDEIIDFAGVERYIDTPVKRYSSGMNVRLGFAVAAFLDPEILVVDEVLTVGDAEFQRKALGKMQEVSHGEGRTVLFVSHNMTALSNLCRRGIVLDEGHVVYDGSTSKAISYYLDSNQIIYGGQTILSHQTWHQTYFHLSCVEINGTEKDESVILSGQKTLTVMIKGDTAFAIDCNINLKLRNTSGHPLATYAPGAYRGELKHIKEGSFILQYEIPLPSYLSEGTIIADLWIHRPQYEDFAKLDACCRLFVEGGIESCCVPLHLLDDGLYGL